MATTYTHAQIGIVDASGNVNVIYPITTGADVSIDRKSNANLPTTATTAQKLANALGALAFKNIADIISTDGNTTSTTKTWSSSVINSKLSELSSNKADCLNYGTFIGNIDSVIDNKEGCLRKNSIVWVVPGASGDLPGEYFILETFGALLDGCIVQKATIYVNQGLPILKQRLYVGDTWSDWEGIVTNSDLSTITNMLSFRDFYTGNIDELHGNEKRGAYFVAVNDASGTQPFGSGLHYTLFVGILTDNIQIAIRLHDGAIKARTYGDFGEGWKWYDWTKD